MTVGGAIANDIHGKNHHAVGSWGDHVDAITLATPARGVMVVGPDTHPEVFWATVGGAGLTGIIVDATFRMQRIETAMISADTDKTENVDDVMSLMSSGDDGLRILGRLDRSVLDRSMARTLGTRAGSVRPRR